MSVCVPLLHTISERVDDLPVLAHLLLEMDVATIVDESLPKPHGNRKGLSYGQLSVVLLCYIMSQADHRLCAVEAWANDHRHSIEQATGWSMHEHDLSDDRLGALVELLGSQGESRATIEVRLGQQMISAYELPTEVARCDTSSFSVHHQVDPEDEPESILRFGVSKDHRPDLRQYRQLLGTIDPAGVPLVSETLAGNGADDPVYLPAWQRLAEVIGHKDFVYIGDCKAASLENRAQIDRQGGLYCFPLPNTGHTPKLLKSWVLAPPAPIQAIRLPQTRDQDPAIGSGFEMELGKIWIDPKTQQQHHWSERYLLVRSEAFAQKQLQQLERRLENAQSALDKLAAKSFEDCCELQTKYQAILKQHRVHDCFNITINYELVSPRRRRGRRRSQQPSPQDYQEQFRLSVERHTCAIEQARQLAGWRIYVTNSPAPRLSLSQAVGYYRAQWQLERGYHRFKRGKLPALPIFLSNEQRIVGLMFVLTIALRGFTVIEYRVRRQLHEHDQQLAGLYAGNPKRKTQRPSAEQLLGAFCNLTRYHHRDGTTEMTPLNKLQRQILKLMAIPEAIYGVNDQSPEIPAPT